MIGSVGGAPVTKGGGGRAAAATFPRGAAAFAGTGAAAIAANRSFFGATAAHTYVSGVRVASAEQQVHQHAIDGRQTGHLVRRRATAIGNAAAHSAPLASAGHLGSRRRPQPLGPSAARLLATLAFVADVCTYVQIGAAAAATTATPHLAETAVEADHHLIAVVTAALLFTSIFQTRGL